MADVGLWLVAVAAALAAASGLVVRDPRHRAAAITFALVLALVLVCADAWHDPRFEDLRDRTGVLALAVIGAAALVVGLALAIRRRPELLAPLAILALPFRIPIESGGDSANLLLPLYAVIAAGALAALIGARSAASAPAPARAASPLRWLPLALGGFVVLYAVQSLYSGDFSQAVVNIGFFLVPFAVLATLLAGIEWTPRVLLMVLAIVAAEGLLFALVAFAEYATRELLWNPAIIEANEVHTHFRVNSLFWDPNIFGRYLAVTITVVAALMLWSRSPRLAGGAGAVAVVLLAALATTLSQSSLVALLGGLAVLAAVRWSARWTAAAFGACLVAGAVAVLAGGGIELDAPTQKSLDVNTSGRWELIRGGLDLAADHPVAGMGSGSFEEEFQERFRAGEEAAGTVSHTEPVTVLAEQGAIGFAAYLAVVAVAFAALAHGIRRYAPGLAGGGAALAGREGRELGAARAAALAALAAMFVHSLSYAAFFTDPITWVLLTIGLALARR